ncbi:hypothetical protein [Cupriavidus campinensis]|uniref:Phage tail protein n=1 Tax=Cupriavidus campinensis TaxID=151783 RepID=A0AAE9HYN0_9BURK|nr:hypothetical protein [Cupriavidus campinensis]URF02782.1 hypothetical protein M5D45_09365 [Cupriavidus campinensis]
MYQIDNSTAAAAQPASTPAGSPGFFTDGNPASGTAATVVPAEWLNAVMMELSNVVTGAGLTLSKPTYNQVLAAIKRLGQSTIILADTGAANAYTATNSTPLVAGTWVDGVVQAVKISHANTGPSTYAPDGLTAIPIYGLGLQPLQGGELALNGTAVLMRATIAGVNSGNSIAVLMECFGGAQQVPQATKSGHAAQFGQLPSIIGETRNAVMDVTSASATGTFTADETIVKSALGGLCYVIPGFNKTINLGTTGAGGMDSGAAPNSGFVGVYAIYNPTTGDSALLAVNATSVVAPEVYGGTNMPAGYTASALVAVWRTTASGQFVTGRLRGRRLSFIAVAVLTAGGAQASYTALSIAGAVPLNAKRVKLTFSGTTNAVGALPTMFLASDSAGCGAQVVSSATSVANQGSTNNGEVVITAPQTIYYQSSTSGGTPTFNISATEMEF